MSAAVGTSEAGPTKLLDSIDLYSVVNSIPAPIIVTSATGRVEAANAAILEFFGKTVDELKGWSSGDWIHADDLPRAVAKWRQALETGCAYENESRHRRCDGVFRWVQVRVFPIHDMEGRISRWLLLQTDVHDRKMAEEALAASERRLSQTVNSIPALAWSAGADGAAEFFNQHYLDYIGLSLEQARGWGWTAAVHPDDLNGLAGAWRSSLASGAAGEAEARLRRFDGEFRWFLCRAAPLRDESDRIVKWFGVNADIEDRKRAEEALFRSEAELRRAQGHLTTAQRLSRTGSFTAGVSTDEHVWSEELYRILEFGRETKLSLEVFRRVIHPEDLPSFNAALRRSVSDGTNFDGIFRVVTPGGKIKHLHTIAHLTEDAAAQPVFVGAIQDVTESRLAEQALAASERNLSLIINAMPGLAWSRWQDGRMEFVNQHFLDYLGLSLEEVQASSWVFPFHPDDLPALLRARESSLASGSSGEAEARIRRFDGEYRWFLCRRAPLRDQSGAIIKWFGINFDIDDRKRAEQAQAASERNLSLIINTMPGLAWSTRTDGIIEFLNQNYLDYLGLSPQQAGNLAWDFAVHPDDAGALRSMGRSAAASGAVGEVEARLRRFDGEFRWFLCRAVPLRDQAGGVMRWFGINFDIEDRKRAEAELRDTQTRLAHMTRILTMGQLTASIAHEVNQPLSGIITNANTCLRMLAANPPNVEGARETARRTIRDGNRASEVIKRLRALFGKKDPALEPLDLNEATREVIALSQSRLHAGRAILCTELADDLPYARGDRVQLQQVILNLIQNALDAMSSVENRPRQMTVRTEREGSGDICLTVQDAGVGFEPGTGGRLFDAFYTTKNEGMGIGLAVSRSIIERHGGRMWAKPNDGPGASFSFSVPLDSGRESTVGSARLPRPGETERGSI